MDLFRSRPLRDWRLETIYDDTGRRYHLDDCWAHVKVLGNGSFGDVWQERCISGPSQNAVRAVKYLHKRQSRFLEISRRELDALITFSDPSAVEYKQHFVQFLGWFDDREHFYLAMELLEYGALQRFITAPFPEPEAASIVTQVAQALQYMHQKNFVHRDIKPLNILVSSLGPNWHVKVADFGIAKKVEGTALATHYIGSPGYIAPELYDDTLDQYTTAVDVWALGAVAYCLRTGFPPFRTIRHLLDYARDHRAQFPIRPLGSSSGFCMNFVLGTMADLPERRLTIEHVLAHDWLSLEKSGDPDGGDLGANSTTSSATWVMAPTNAWSNTYDNTETQQAQPLSPRTPITPKLGSLPPHSSSPPPHELTFGDQLASEKGKLTVGSSHQGDGMTTRMQPNKDWRKKLKEINDMANVAINYHQQKKYDRAEMIGEDVVKLRQQLLGYQHPDTVDALTKLALTYREQGKHSQAQTTYVEIYDLQCESLGKGHPDTIATLKIISVIKDEHEMRRPPADVVEQITVKDIGDKPNLNLSLTANIRREHFFGFTNTFAVVRIGTKTIHRTKAMGIDPIRWEEDIDLKVDSDTVLNIDLCSPMWSKRNDLNLRVGDIIDLSTHSSSAVEAPSSYIPSLLIGIK